MDFEGAVSFTKSYPVKHQFLLIRDPFNWYTSVLGDDKHKWNQILDKLIVIWKKHAREFLGDTNKLPEKISINFNSWFSSPAYRRELSKKFGRRHSDKSINTVAKSGSSFDDNMHGRATKMNVLSRWKMMIHDIKYQKMLQDSEIIELSERIFGDAIYKKVIKSLNS